ncbi:hypothetical protein [Amycolatopsis kentuckyensis]|uniref:hypothetical protein n=1 Tax=Amycolatopsis kentuckyensis TaxID=218823 RepID=UPI000A3C7B61|nr:hypothetical protein [Amycolatopsis kentuckyensis]
MPQPVYSYQIADLATNRILEDVALTGVRFNKPLCASGKFAANWKLGPKTAHLDAYDLSMPCRRVVYAYRDDRPVWGGIIWTRAYDSATQTVAIGAGDWWSYFDHRKVLPVFTADGTLTQVAALTQAYATTDQNAIARQLVATAQAHTGGDILVVPADMAASGQLRDRTYNGYDLAEVGDALTNLANVINGPDICFDVLPGTSAPQRVIQVGTPTLGQQGSAHRWEVGGNATRYAWPSDGTRMNTRSFATGQGVELGLPIAVAEDTTKYTGGFPLLENEAQYGSAEDAGTLNGHAEADQEAGRMPVVLPKILIRGDLPPTAAEVSRGDDGWLKVPPDPFHKNGWEGPVRVVDMAFAPGLAAERVELTMAPLLDGVA